MVRGVRDGWMDAGIVFGEGGKRNTEQVRYN